jgi:L-fucose mutarotase
MGHGDEVAVVDANFTVHSLAGDKPIIRLDGVNLLRACQAVLSVFPLDEAVKQPVGFMKVSNTAEGFVNEAQQEVLHHLRSIDAAHNGQCEPIERFAFYERVKNAYAFVVTGEMRTYANFVFKKGVIT